MKKLRRIAEKDVPRVATHREQTGLWVAGKNVHVQVGSSFECCPDFSCCYPDCAVSPALRRKFAASDAPAREAFLGRFLAAFIEKISDGSRNVHLVGTVPRGRRG